MINKERATEYFATRADTRPGSFRDAYVQDEERPISGNSNAFRKDFLRNHFDPEGVLSRVDRVNLWSMVSEEAEAVREETLREALEDVLIKEAYDLVNRASEEGRAGEYVGRMRHVDSNWGLAQSRWQIAATVKLVLSKIKGTIR